MTSTVHADSPAALAQPCEAAPMSSHVLNEPWNTPTLSSAGVLKVGSVVPRTVPESVLAFSQDGTPVGLVADPTVIPAEVAVWAKAQLAHVPGYKPLPWPGPHSGSCGTRWEAPEGGMWLCTLPAGHGPGIRCEAQGVKGAVLASPTEALATEAMKPSPRKRTVRKVASA
jgi:hypothetical protein